jgi:hypothetical protein
MRTQANTATSLAPPRRVPIFTIGLPIVACDQQGNEIARFRSGRKFGKALASAELILVAGDKIHVGQIPGVVS